MDRNLHNVNGSKGLPGISTEESEIKVAGNGQSELADILASATFRSTPTLRRLLTYLWERKDGEVSEYAIATEALGRRPDFDPREDATVRVLVSRLRGKLKDFYESDGASLPTRIVIPVGSHRLQIVEAPQLQLETAITQAKDGFDPESLSISIQTASQREARNRKVVLAEAIAIAVLLFICVGLIVERNAAVSRALNGQTHKLPVFWHNFLENGKNTQIVVPTPVFFSWGTGFMARDVNVNDFGRIENSSFLNPLVHALGKPNLSQQYVAAPDVLALLRLHQYLDPRGVHLSISTTAESPIDILDRENLIVAGTPRTLAPFQTILDRLGFAIDAEKRELVDRRPTTGAPRKFETVQQSPLRVSTPGIIACVPGGTQGTKVLLFVTTYYTSALVSYVTSEGGLSELQAAQKAHGNPTYFEAVILSEINGTTDLKSHLIEFRPLLGKNQ